MKRLLVALVVLALVFFAFRLLHRVPAKHPGRLVKEQNHSRTEPEIVREQPSADGPKNRSLPTITPAMLDQPAKKWLANQNPKPAATPKATPIAWSSLAAILWRERPEQLDRMKATSQTMIDNRYGSPSYDENLIFGSAGYLLWYQSGAVTQLWLQSSAANDSVQHENYDFEIGIQDSEGWKEFKSKERSLTAEALGGDRKHILITAGSDYVLQTRWFIEPSVNLQNQEQRVIGGYLFSPSGKILARILLIEWDVWRKDEASFKWPPAAAFKKILQTGIGKAGDEL